MTLILLLLGILPGFVWLLFYLEEDTDHEPMREVFFAFLIGSAITIIVLFTEQLYAALGNIIGIAPYSFISFLGLSSIEEFFKFAAAYLVVSKSRYFDIPVDAMIYMVVVALGFATLENIFAVSGEFKNAAALSSAAETASLRFVGATLLHTLASATVGYYWAKAMTHGSWVKNLVTGLSLATGLHTVFNYLVSVEGVSIIYPVILLTVAGFFVLNDFDKLKHPEKLGVAPFFKKRVGAQADMV
ncbi:MAG: PrsW family intramembrane metalloprotease [Candidatus Liptonbacteria bacterium]|nr:PrsW family intramembrane metalloprotease [Candidatus Liptonbacteria bacterium]